MTVDPRSDRAIYRQVADILRAQIADGTLAPGTMLPSEKQLADTYGVGRDAVRQAISLLRAEGVTRSAKGQRTVVRDQVDRRAIPLSPGSRVIARMPSEVERVARHMDEGVPMIVVTNPDGQMEAYPADEVSLTVPTGRRSMEQPRRVVQ